MSRNHPLISRNYWNACNGKCAFCGKYQMQERVEPTKGYVYRCKACNKRQTKPEGVRMANNLVATAKDLDKPNADFNIGGGGSIYILTPLTDAGQLWVEEHLPADAQRWGNGVVIEHRYIMDIVNSLRAEGYTVRG